MSTKLPLEDAVLRRMLKTPPKPAEKKPEPAKKTKRRPTK